MKKVSIIIPVYNVNHNRFKKTLDSLVNQTLDNVEIICINDNSEKCRNCIEAKIKSICRVIASDKGFHKCKI